MCGIVGYITNESKKGWKDHGNFMKEGLVIDTLRGFDSTGLMAIKTRAGTPKDKAGCTYRKSVQNGSEFVRTPGFPAMISTPDKVWSAFGHNRWATIGSVSDETAHPFAEGGICLMHNGTLKGTHTLPKSMHDLKVEVDSHALAHNVALVGVDDVEEEVLSKIRGSYALVWWDGRDKSLNIAKNRDRPLHVIEDRKEGNLWFCSEARQLNFINEGVKFSTKTEIQEIRSMQHLKWFEGELTPQVKEYKETHVYPAYSPPKRNGHWSNKTAVKDRDSSNQVLCGPKALLKPVPDALREGLKDIKLTVNDRLIATVIADMGNHVKLSNNFSSYTAAAFSTTLDQDIIIPNMPARLRHTLKEGDPLLVRPVGVFYADGSVKGDRRTIVCALIDGYNVGTEEYFEILDNTDDDEDIDGGGEEEQIEEPVVKAGPNGKIPVSTFIDITAAGCCMCSDPINVADAGQLVWYDQNDAICPACNNQANLDMYEIDKMFDCHGNRLDTGHGIPASIH